VSGVRIKKCFDHLVYTALSSRMMFLLVLAGSPMNCLSIDLVQVPEQVYGLPEAIIGSRVTGFLDPVRDDMTSVGIFSRLDNVYTSVLTGHNSLGRKE
jgi:hypothetical protein